MILSDICIRRPVLATVLSLLIVLVGMVSYDRLSVREYPKIDPPVITVETRYTGASAEIMESQVTQVVEDSVAGIEGIDYMSSISRAEISQITIVFLLDRDPDDAAADVRDRVGRTRDRLPDEIDEPIIKKVEADAQPILYLGFSSDKHSALQLTDFAERYVKDRLQSLPGVSEVMIFAERRYSMRIWLKPENLAAYGLTVQDVENALRQQNVEVPSGRIESRAREFTVLAETDLKTPEEFNNIIIKNEGGYLVRLADVGYAAIGPEDERTVVRFSGRNAVGLGLVKQATANLLDVTRAVREELPGLTDSLPEGMRLDVSYDKGVFVEESLKNVYQAIAEAAILVILIIFLFLRSVRATMVPLVTIPVSLIGSFALMLAFGFSINLLTLLAFVLAIGLVVDDAIVMLENIFRHVEKGENPYQAAVDGAREIGFAVLAMTLTLAAVYAPMGFLVGKTGRLFTEFAWTLAGAVLVSGFVALTLSPMMCSKLLRHQKDHNFFYNIIERGLSWLTDTYRAVLAQSLRVRPLVILIGLLVAGVGVFLYLSLPSELAPYEDQGAPVVIYLAPEGSTIEYIDNYGRQIEPILKGVPEIERYFLVSGWPLITQGMIFAKLVPWDKRERSQQEIVRSLGPKLFGITGVLAFPMNPPPLGQSARTKPVEFIIQTSQPYKELDAMLNKIVAEASSNPGFINLDTDLKLNKPELKIQVNREKLADMGIAVETVGRTLETLLGGRQVTRYKDAGEQYDVIVQLTDLDRSNPDDLRRLYVRAQNGQMVPLSNLVRVRETVAPRELNHFNQLRSATISANLAPDYPLGDALSFLETVAEKHLPKSARIDYSGVSREFMDASASIYMVFVLSIAFVYLVLAAQFESFVDPFIILLTVPLSIAGAVLALYLTGGTLNIYSQVGLVTLIGLITKHGILIVEFANQLRERGSDLREAVVEAATLRLRPILMTTGAMVLGAVPLAIATGAGAESRQAIGWVIVGGLLVGTFFTLFIIPTAYTLIARRHRQTGEEEEAGSDTTPAGAPQPAE